MNRNEITSKEKYNIANSLVGLVQSLIGKSLLVELQNNCQVAGILETCDGYMNLTLNTVVVIDCLGKQYGFDNFMVTKRNIRYVHFPKHIMIIPQIEAELNKLRRKKLNVNTKRTYKQKRSEINQKKTLMELKIE